MGGEVTAPQLAGLSGWGRWARQSSPVGVAGRGALASSASVRYLPNRARCLLAQRTGAVIDEGYRIRGHKACANSTKSLAIEHCARSDGRLTAASHRTALLWESLQGQRHGLRWKGAATPRGESNPPVRTRLRSCRSRNCLRHAGVTGVPLSPVVYQGRRA